jgi:hypothetical protein
MGLPSLLRVDPAPIGAPRDNLGRGVFDATQRPRRCRWTNPSLMPRPATLHAARDPEPGRPARRDTGHCLRSCQGPTVKPTRGGTVTEDQHGASTGDGISAATRLLEIATRNADELLEEAKAEAASITSAAQADSERVHAELEKARTDQNSELERRRTTVLSQLAERQAALEAEVARLESLEQEIRTRTRSFLTEQLERIDATPDPEVSGKATA